MNKGVSRRDLGRRAALSAAALALGAKEAAPQGRGGQAGLAASDQAEVDAKFASVVRKYGDRLSEEQKTRVRGVLGNHQRMIARVRAFPIENPDAPATGLRLYPNDTGVPKAPAKPGAKG
jgi:hypothetical protein